MYNGIKIAHIVATDLNGCIGRDGKMPWHIPADLKRFKELTEGGVVIMGRKTFESLGCKPLPDRLNLVISSKRIHSYPAMVFNDIEGAIGYGAEEAFKLGLDTIWIIGGAEIYAQTMQYVDEILATIVQTRIDGGDAFYDVPKQPFNLVELSNTMTDEKSSLNYRYSKHVRFLSGEVQDGKA